MNPHPASRSPAPQGLLAQKPPNQKPPKALTGVTGLFALLALPAQRPFTGCVDARDLRTHIGDSVHFDTAAQEEIGRRYAATYLRLAPSARPGSK